ncbi:MAG TPA: NAD-dependent deacylase [Polyangiaceae bacterium]|jgi:NAD-dependent deacetylase|nr:MAG: NAD-dependent protein deacylase [Deltaproteobacteria bacterium ADurb.Bin207]HNT00080.1 NAD-dependent deacylase [Polyangiaceae bacterium]HNZ24440.1 NAD-dependent deacylase [Polyangiaceae bacterium]HOD22503.1 NAD-dependent deacylase [Polyangiaceae bacterium]HOE49189.1 NAD-dependent deacylase [Polyangiaceae bacterium]
MPTIANDASVVVLTGAGISVASGLAPFRGPGGLWNDHDIEKYVTASAWRQTPEIVMEFLASMRSTARASQPNEAHFALARAERARTQGARFDVITQNIDALHSRAGSRNVHEIHGSLEIDRCEACEQQYPVDSVKRCVCGGSIRPHIVLFGEMLPEDVLMASQRALRSCDTFVAVGTSGIVWPAAGFVLEARAAGAHCINVNLEPSGNPSFHEELIGPAEQILPRLFGVEV